MLDKLALLLPPQDADPKVTAWRYVMAVSIMACIAVLAGFFTGVIAPARSAMADQLSEDLAQVAKKQDRSDQERLEQQIFDARIAQCMAVGQLKTVYADRVAQLVAKWRNLTKQQVPPPTLVDCNDLG